ncbi:MAG: hypothetical protein JSS68_10595 [Actinobacteria bacterium]|nr:hypothetical protein [Actinomycetota bacterium]
MRYIDLDLVLQELPEGWSSEATAAFAEIQAISDPSERSVAINKHRAVWANLKAHLMHASFGKCWYCEANEKRSPGAVDHFRPKDGVEEDEDHGGYWWLAFDPSNFRFSCYFCNTFGSKTRSVPGGKRTHFPLVDEGARISSPEADLDEERALLLDPVVPSDPGLLWFDLDGRAAPMPDLDPNGLSYLRAAKSVEIYNLNEARVKDARMELSTAVSEAVAEADGYWKKVETKDPTAHTAFEKTVRRLRRLVDREAEFSAAARAALMGLRGQSVVPDIVLRDL